MRPSDAGPRFDWKAWLALGWVVWFGLLYGRMVVERRGAAAREAVRAWAAPGR